MPFENMINVFCLREVKTRITGAGVSLFRFSRIFDFDAL